MINIFEIFSVLVVKCNYKQRDLRTLEVCPTIIRTGDGHHSMLDKNNANREQGEVTMAGLIFAISILSILATVGFLFAWMVRLASNPEHTPEPTAQNVAEGELAPSSISTPRR